MINGVLSSFALWGASDFGELRWGAFRMWVSVYSQFAQA